MRRATAACSLSLVLVLGHASAAVVDPPVRRALQEKPAVDVLILMADNERPQLAPLSPGAPYRLRRRALVEALRGRSQTSQANLLRGLASRGITARSFWLVNAIQARITPDSLPWLEADPEVRRVAANPKIALSAPPAGSQGDTAHPKAPQGVEWNVEKIRAPEVWAQGFTGQGVVIGGQDTGYQWDHPALKNQYRGWGGSSADHNHHWHDAVHDPAPASCPANSPAPCDDYGHGTHTAGTFAGDDGGANQIGVAPGARWIGCRNMNAGWGTPARYIECMQWFLAPTDLAGNHPNPDLAPDVISNSWYCDEDEGCTVGNELDDAIAALADAGILFVAAAGNDGRDGDGCSTTRHTPATHPASFVVGASTSNDWLTSFTSRGPLANGGPIRPDVVAPGLGIRSSFPNNSYGNNQGTSMATPHVAGAAALLISSYRHLRGQPERIAQLLRETATQDGISDPYQPSGCGGLDMGDWPNHQAGWGRLDVAAAVTKAREHIFFEDGFEP